MPFVLKTASNPLAEFEIEFIKLKPGQHEFNYQLENSFFEAFDNVDVLETGLSVKAELERFPNWMNVLISIKGHLGLTCDRCLEKVNIPVESDYRLIYKMTDDMAPLQDTGDVALIHLKPGDISFNIANPIYETTMLALPMIRNCDDLEVKPCNSQMLDKLKQLDQNEANNDTENTDPRWDKLKDLLK